MTALADLPIWTLLSPPSLNSLRLGRDADMPAAISIAPDLDAMGIADAPLLVTTRLMIRRAEALGGLTLTATGALSRSDVRALFDAMAWPGYDKVQALAMNTIAEVNSEKAWVEPDREPYEAELRESQLVQRFETWLKSHNHQVYRLRIVPEGEAKPIFNDVWVPSLNLLVEAKGTCTREAVRMAIGQLIDYGRFQPGAKLALLLPSAPRTDLLKLIGAAGLGCFWEDRGTFHSTDVATPKTRSSTA